MADQSFTRGVCLTEVLLSAPLPHPESSESRWSPRRWQRVKHKKGGCWCWYHRAAGRLRAAVECGHVAASQIQSVSP